MRRCIALAVHQLAHNLCRKHEKEINNTISPLNAFQ